MPPKFYTKIATLVIIYDTKWEFLSLTGRLSFTPPSWPPWTSWTSWATGKDASKHPSKHFVHWERHTCKWVSTSSHTIRLL